MPVNLPTNLIRSFVAIVDTGSMLNASEQVFVTQSALSLQIKRLEELVQQALFVRDGRRLSLTAAGQVMLDYSRRVLALHDEAVTAVTAGDFTGPARFGMVQDFAETLLGGLLSRFSELHPDAQIYARVAGTVELQHMLGRNQLDVVLGFGGPADAQAIAVAPMGWYGQATALDKPMIPLAVLEQPCRFREAAIRALEDAGLNYRIAVETPNLATLRAAVNAGLGITCRTHLFPCDVDHLVDPRLPELPRVSVVLRTRDDPDLVAQRLANLAVDAVNGLPRHD